MVRNYYTASIPDSILEAARIDGATEMQIYRKILVPLSKPVMITIALFAGMAYWNDWSNGLYYISEPKLYSINVYLNNLMNNIQMLKQQSSMTEGVNLSGLELPSVGAQSGDCDDSCITNFSYFPVYPGTACKRCCDRWRKRLNFKNSLYLHRAKQTVF